MGVASEILQLIGEVNTLTTFVNSLLGNQQQQATKGDMQANFALTNQLITLVYNALTSNTEQERQIWSDLISRLGGLGVQIGVPQQATQPVKLPTTPPAGYGGLDGPATASAVWDAQSADELTQYGTIAAALSAYLRVIRDSAGLDQRIGDHFGISVDPFSLTNNPNTSFPSHSAAEIDAGDGDLLAFLERIEPTFTWHQLADGTYWAALPGTAGGALMYCSLTPEEFQWYKFVLAGGLIKPYLPPVFPGIANVTYGSPQSMDAPNGSLSGPADGYKIQIDAVPSWAGKFDFGVLQSYRNVGAIAFVDDEGVPEFPQTFGFTTVHYVPKSMAHSVGAYYRLSIGFHAVGTPFMITS